MNPTARYRNSRVRNRTGPRSSGTAAGMRVAPCVNPTRLRTAVLSTASPPRERCRAESNKCSIRMYVRSFFPGRQVDLCAGWAIRFAPLRWSGGDRSGVTSATRQGPRRGLCGARCQLGGGGPDDLAVGEGRGHHRLLQEAVEEQAAVGGAAAVEAEGELVQVP